MKRILKPAALAAAFLLTTALAAQAASTAPRGDQIRPGIDPVTTRGMGDGQIATPGEAFFPQRPKQLYPCFVDLDENGEPQVHFTNQSGIDYPLGTEVKIAFSNGEIGTYIYSASPFPDLSQWIQGLPLDWVPPLTCTVEVIPPEDEDVPK